MARCNRLMNIVLLVFVPILAVVLGGCAYFLKHELNAIRTKVGIIESKVSDLGSDIKRVETKKADVIQLDNIDIQSS